MAEQAPVLLTRSANNSMTTNTLIWMQLKGWVRVRCVSWNMVLVAGVGGLWRRSEVRVEVGEQMVSVGAVDDER